VQLGKIAVAATMIWTLRLTSLFLRRGLSSLQASRDKMRHT